MKTNHDSKKNNKAILLSFHSFWLTAYLFGFFLHYNLECDLGMIDGNLMAH